MKRNHFAFAVLLLLTTFVPLGFGQTGATATILGTITDPSSALVAAAKVTATNISTNLSRTAETGPEGQFTIVSLPIGPYQVRVEAAGFRTAEVRGVELVIDQRARVDVQLAVGQVSEQVTIQSDALLVKTDDSSNSQVLTQKAILDLPLNGRNFIQLTRLTAAVHAGDYYGPGDTAAGSVYGQRDSNTQFRLDGIETTEYTGNQFRLAPNIDAIQEFVLIKGIYPAEFGKVSGGTVNVAVRSGTNQLHGTVFEFLRNDKLQARNYFDRTGTVPNLRRNQFGVTAGGPIRKDKLFVFASYDGVRERRATVGTTRVPTPEQIQGNLSTLGKTIVDPLTGTPFSGNTIPSNRIHRISKALAQFWPTPNNPADPPRNYLYSGSRSFGPNQYLLRSDYSPSTKDQFFFRYAFAKSEDARPPVIYPFSIRIADISQGAVLGHSHTFSPSVLNEARFGFTRIKFDYTSLQQLPNFPIDANIPDVTRDPKFADVPSTSITGYAGLGGGSTEPFFKTQNNFEFLDNVMIQRGPHAFKAGLNIVRRQAQQLVPISKKGGFTFDGNFSGDNLGDFLLGYPRTTSLGESPYITAANLRTTDVYGYFQDDWHVSSRLTLNLGLRYEYVAPPSDMHGTTINFNRYTADFVPAPLTGGQKLSNSDRNNFAPRFGFAFRPLSGNKTVLRGGYGLFYNMSNYDEYLYLPYNPPFGNQLTYQSLPNRPTLTLDNPFPRGVGSMSAPSAYGIDPDFRIGYVQTFTFGIQQAIAPNTVLEVGYVGSKSTRLAKAFDVNYAPPGPGAVQQRRILRQDIAGAFVVLPVSNASYHSLQTQLERRFSAGLYLLTSYAYGKALDDVAGSSGDKGSPQYQDPRCPHQCEKGTPAFDVRQRFTLNAIYQLPFGKGRTWMTSGGIADVFLGGWELGSIYARQTGRRLSAGISGDPLNVGTGRARANYIGGAVTVSDPTIDNWFNTAAFARPADYTPGNSGRGILIGPGLDSWDFAVYKTFHFTERHRLQFRTEFFNFPNHTNFSNPGTTLGTGNFGKITSALTARETQFGLKYMF